MYSSQYPISVADGELNRLLSQPTRGTVAHAWYSPPNQQDVLPDLLAFRLPPGLAPETDNIRIVAADNSSERLWLERALDLPMQLKATAYGPALLLPTHELESSRSGLPRVSEVVLAIYDPPTDGWPWLSVGIFPQPIEALLNAENKLLRGRYLWSEYLSVDAVREQFADALNMVTAFCRS